MFALRAPRARVDSRPPTTSPSREPNMPRSATLLATTMVLGAMLTGCGLAETGAVAAAGGASHAEQARQGNQTGGRGQQQGDAPVQLDPAPRHAAEAESQ